MIYLISAFYNSSLKKISSSKYIKPGVKMSTYYERLLEAWHLLCELAYILLQKHRSLNLALTVDFFEVNFIDKYSKIV